jgi:hypothetical protein
MDKIKIGFLAAIAAIAPIQGAMITVFALVMLDFILGVMAARKRGEKITSSGFKATVVKIFVYELAITMAHFVGIYLTGPGIPVLQMAASMIGITELKSVLENLETITGDKMLGTIAKKLGIEDKPPEA